jgi:hypothetical protein
MKFKEEANVKKKNTSGRGRYMGRGSTRMNMVQVNTKMIPIETNPGIWGGGDEREWLRRIQL